MVMSEQEIVREYRLAKKPGLQISILAQQNCCSREKIYDILVENGIEINKRVLNGGSKKRPMKIVGVDDPVSEPVETERTAEVPEGAEPKEAEKEEAAVEKADVEKAAVEEKLSEKIAEQAADVTAEDLREERHKPDPQTLIYPVSGKDIPQIVRTCLYMKLDEIGTQIEKLKEDQRIILDFMEGVH